MGHRWLVDMGLGDPETLRQRITRGCRGLQAIAPQILNVGQGALGLFLTLGVMLYLTFFLLRDGRGLPNGSNGRCPCPHCSADVCCPNSSASCAQPSRAA
jgi:predicted PurR-regulated permease PerM